MSVYFARRCFCCFISKPVTTKSNCVCQSERCYASGSGTEHRAVIPKVTSRSRNVYSTCADTPNSQGPPQPGSLNLELGAEPATSAVAEPPGHSGPRWSPRPAGVSDSWENKCEIISSLCVCETLKLGIMNQTCMFPKHNRVNWIPLSVSRV